MPETLETFSELEGGESDMDMKPPGMTDEEFVRQLMDEEVALMAMQQDMNRKFPEKKEKRYNDETMISVNSLGEERSFASIRQSEIEKQIWRIKLEFYIDIAVLALIVTLISIHLHQNPNGCGIPVREWILVFFIIWLTKSTFNLFKIYVLRNAYESRFTFTATLFIIMNGILVIWLFIGYALYYSDSNDCSSK